jgi:hypothetical protein
MTTILIFFGLAAVGGLTMAFIRFRGAPTPPLPLALLHGAGAATGLILLLLYVMRGGGGGLVTPALICFVLAAVGGFAMFAMHLTKKALPIPLVVIHGIAAVIGFSLLLAVAFQASS